MEKNIIIAPVGDNMDALFIGLREFPTEKVILLSPPNRVKDAEKALQDLDRFKIPTKIMEIKGNVWEEMFRKIAEIREAEKDKNILVNTATGDRLTTCAATSAAFVNGIKAFSVDNGMPMLLPVLKFSYYKMLTDKKMEILKMLSNPDCCMSLEELSKKTKMSLPLISYHINGNLKSEGLKEMGLVETNEKKGRIEIKLSTLGRMLIKGYVS
jgi:DNA-binding transcriptional ArsR family regulator